MQISNVGVMSPGVMGQAVAVQLKAKGLAVYTALEGQIGKWSVLNEATSTASA